MKERRRWLPDKKRSCSKFQLKKGLTRGGTLIIELCLGYNILLEKILNFEGRLLRKSSLKYGGSIILVAEK